MFGPATSSTWVTFLPLVGAVLIVPCSPALRSRRAVEAHASTRPARAIALVASGLSLRAPSLVALVRPARAGLLSPASPGSSSCQQAVWIRAFNVEYFVGVDGLSISMVLLSGLISFIATIASMPWWSGRSTASGRHGRGRHATRTQHFSVRAGYMVMLLLLQTGMMGTFVSLDMFLFYVFWEVMLLPMYFLIGIWGGAAQGVRGDQVLPLHAGRLGADAARDHRPLLQRADGAGGRAARAHLQHGEDGRVGPRRRVHGRAAGPGDGVHQGRVGGAVAHATAARARAKKKKKKKKKFFFFFFFFSRPGCCRRGSVVGQA